MQKMTPQYILEIEHQMRLKIELERLKEALKAKQIEYLKQTQKIADLTALEYFSSLKTTEHGNRTCND